MALFTERPLVLPLAPMEQLVEAKGADDDWTGLMDRAERRKRQTRLNVRAHRKRKAAATSSNPKAAVQLKHGSVEDTGPSLFGVLVLSTPGPARPGPHPQPSSENLSRTLQFPLSPDHLIPLIEYNVFRASLTNIYIMSLFSLLQNATCDAHLGLSPPPLFPSSGSSVPESLRPTALQTAVPHDVWIDILPSPGMRDNAIRAVRAGVMRQGGLCEDVLRGMCGPRNKGDVRGTQRADGARADGARADGARADGTEEDGEEARMIVWTDPWEPGGWEVTEGFSRKYGFLLRGCEDMLSATNRWRQVRGDEPIVWDVA